MHANTDTGVGALEGRSPAYGVPSPDLLARADRGFSRFLERIDDQDDDGDGGQDALR
jgi:hypothetical protein